MYMYIYINEARIHAIQESLVINSISMWTGRRTGLHSKMYFIGNTVRHKCCLIYHVKNLLTKLFTRNLMVNLYGGCRQKIW